MVFNESETRKNLMRAFAGECQSRQRYYQSALIAQQQKYIGIERMFRFTAEQEERHAMGVLSSYEGVGRAGDRDLCRLSCGCVYRYSAASGRSGKR